MKTVIKHNRIQGQTWIEEEGFPGSTITYINEDELNQLLENGEVKRINGQSDVGVNGKERVNPIEVYEMAEKKNPDSPYTKIQIDIDYNAKMLYLNGDEIQYPELLEWPEFATLEANEESSRMYTMKKNWVSALFETTHFLKAKKAHLEFELDSRRNTINNCEYEMKMFSQRAKDAREDLIKIEKEIANLPFCQICGERLYYEQEMPVAEKIMYSWTCSNCKNSEMRSYKEAK